jgi:Fe-S oxidoreductase
VELVTGHVQTRPILNLSRPEDCSRLPALSETIHELALSLGGTINFRGGVGLARSSWVARQAGPLYPLLRQIKAVFDPQGLFNPGKIVDPDLSLARWPLRTLAIAPAQRILAWTRSSAEQEANHCNGCGQCRTALAPERMCPIFRAKRSEAATPRAKANLLRHLFQSSEPSALSSDEVRAVADLCVNCKMCAVECPAHVNIPKLMLEAKAANVAAHGLDRSEWFLARLQGFARWGHRFRRLVNLSLRTRPGRWLLNKLFGLATRRRLPLLAKRTFQSLARERGWDKPPAANGKPRAVLFVDLFANYFDPQIAEAAALALQHQGYDVIIPPGQVSSGIEALAHGDAEATRDLARRNLQALAEFAREGLPIVCVEPSAALMLRQDYLDLLDDHDARLVAGQTVEFMSFLGDLNKRGNFRTDFRSLPMHLAHHVPCHLKALGPSGDGSLLRRIPELKVTTLDLGCSGMAGTFGLQEQNYALSLEAGQPMLGALARADARYGVTECSSCRLQMEDGAKKRTLHPAQFLALAYGLLPEVEKRLAEPIRELVLR